MGKITVKYEGEESSVKLAVMLGTEVTTEQVLASGDELTVDMTEDISVTVTKEVP